MNYNKFSRHARYFQYMYMQSGVAVRVEVKYKLYSLIIQKNKSSDQLLLVPVSDPSFLYLFAQHACCSVTLITQCHNSRKDEVHRSRRPKPRCFPNKMLGSNLKLYQSYQSQILVIHVPDLLLSTSACMLLILISHIVSEGELCDTSFN